MQLIYLNDIFEDNYTNERDLFETDAGNVIKNRPLVAKKQKGILIFISLAQPIRNCHEGQQHLNCS